MIKVVCLFKKRAGMSTAEFRDYYENHHIRIFDGLMKNPGIKRYVRRYLTPIADPTTGTVHSSGFDVIMELWISDRELFESQFQSAQESEFRTLVAADEARLFDRTEMYSHIVDEVESDLSQLRGGA
ncbi:EthD domain-containing protein [Amycolatopsis sp. GM8]|uniref:EthD domain-containing protein n=1 Tax=Amycolatopsis sp. GM8 TaxID=2896530 RepID=UPI001F347AC5|nr:EthD domain-containing protein [Amycolatopsis sp. GM8]